MFTRPTKSFQRTQASSTQIIDCTFIVMKQKKSTKKFLKGAAKSAVKAKHEGKPTGKKFGKPGAGKPVGKKAVGGLGEAHREDQVIKLKNPKSKKGGGDMVKG